MQVVFYAAVGRFPEKARVLLICVGLCAVKGFVKGLEEGIPQHLAQIFRRGLFIQVSGII